MKYWVVIVFFLGFLGLAKAQETSENKQAVPASVGIRIGEKAPAFRALDQFDHNQSNGTLRGSNGTILLFFRSADW